MAAARVLENGSGRASFVVSLKPAHVAELDGLPELGMLNRTMIGGVHRQ